MKGLISRVLWVIAFVVAFVIINRVSTEFQTERAAENKYHEIEKVALDKYADAPKADALQQAAVEVASADLSQLDGADRANFAAENFFGFLWMNTRLRRDYCEDLGVDITPFVRVFSEAHVQERERAEEIFRNAGTNEEEMWRLYRQQEYLHAFIRQDMQDFQKGAELDSQNAACAAFIEFADDLVKEIHLSKRIPEIHKALMSE